MARTARRGGALRRLFLWTTTIGLLAGGLVAFILWRELTGSLPPVDQLLRYQPPVTTRIFADDGTLIGEMYVERRYLVPLDRVPGHVRLAFLAAEDADFYRHHGVNPVSIARAFYTNLSRKHVVQGGSTITQQVVKNLLLSSERSYERKAKEFILAVRLESKLSKDDILYLYLNQIYFGGGAYGIAAAARAFFDVDVGRPDARPGRAARRSAAEAERVRPATPSEAGAGPPAVRAVAHARGGLHHPGAVRRGPWRAAHVREAEAGHLPRRPVVRGARTPAARGALRRCRGRARSARAHGRRSRAAAAGGGIPPGRPARAGSASGLPRPDQAHRGEEGAGVPQSRGGHEERHRRGPPWRRRRGAHDGAHRLHRVGARRPRRGQALLGPVAPRPVALQAGRRDRRHRGGQGARRLRPLRPRPGPAGRRCAGGARPVHRRGEGDGRRIRFQPQRLQPGAAGEAPAGLGVQAARLCRCHRQGLHVRLRGARRADHAEQRQPARLVAEELRQPLLRADAAPDRTHEEPQQRDRPPGAGDRHRLRPSLRPALRPRGTAPAELLDGARHVRGDAARTDARIRRVRDARQALRPDLHHGSQRSRRPARSSSAARAPTSSA